jgi:hypothetical protein
MSCATVQSRSRAAVVRLLRSRSIICSWVVQHPFSDAHNPAARLRNEADESAQPMLVRRIPSHFSPRDALKKSSKRLFRQIVEEH